MIAGGPATSPISSRRTNKETNTQCRVKTEQAGWLYLSSGRVWEKRRGAETIQIRRSSITRTKGSELGWQARTGGVRNEGVARPKSRRRSGHFVNKRNSTSECPSSQFRGTMQQYEKRPRQSLLKAWVTRQEFTSAGRVMVPLFPQEKISPSARAQAF